MKIFKAIILAGLFLAFFVSLAISEENNDIKLTIEIEKTIYYQPEDILARISFIAQKPEGAKITNPEVINGTAFLFFDVRRVEKDGSFTLLAYSG